MKKIISRNKSIALLFFLFGYNNLFGYGGSSSCSGNSTYVPDQVYKEQICNEKSKLISERLKDKHSFIYLKIPELGDEYLEYGNEELEYNLEPDRRKERTLPIHIEVGNALLNPRKDDYLNYKVSSKLKERIISENYTIKRRNCTFMALGSEYLFPIPSGEGVLSVILYFNYAQDVARYRPSQRKYNSMIPDNQFDMFKHRSLLTEINFKPGYIYQLEIATNPNSGLSRKSYTAWAIVASERMNTVPGFTITLKELPPNTKFAFDGKDDVGKTYEQVKKEFILYDKSAE